MVLGVAIVLTWIGDLTKDLVPIASLLGVLAMGLVILEKTESLGQIIAKKLQRLWVFAELLLFVLVGAQVNPKVAWGAGAAGLAIIGFGLVFRSLGTYLSVLGAGLTWREKLFCVMSYIPKATVQAAIGAIPLEAGVPGGELILAMAVLSVLITAPPGAIAISLWGERVLEAGGTQRLSLFHPAGPVETAPGGPAGAPQGLRRRVEGYRRDGNLGPEPRRDRRRNGPGSGLGPPVLEVNEDRPRARERPCATVTPPAITPSTVIGRSWRPDALCPGLAPAGAWRFIILLGVISLLSDMTYEGARSISGPFLGTLKASALVVGVVAAGGVLGIALRLASGYLADRLGRYWLITFAGYALNLLAVPLLALAGSWEIAAMLLVVERIGKAIRTPARDAMLSHATARGGAGLGLRLP